MAREAGAAPVKLCGRAKTIYDDDYRPGGFVDSKPAWMRRASWSHGGSTSSPMARAAIVSGGNISSENFPPDLCRTTGFIFGVPLKLRTGICVPRVTMHTRSRSKDSSMRSPCRRP